MGEVAEARLLGRAFAERWPVSDEQRRAAIDRLVGIVDKGSDKAAVAAVRALVAADLANLKLAELQLAMGPAEAGDDAVVIDADPEIARLEAALLARRAAIGSGNAGRPGLGDDERTLEVAEPTSPDGVERGAEDRGDDSGLDPDRLDATSAREELHDQ